MGDLCRLIWCVVAGLFRSRAALHAEILVLRHQLNVLRRKSPKRLVFNGIDRLVFNRDGSPLMIHGDCSSSGCYAMTDEQMGEIYSLARDSLLGRPSFQVQAYPFRLTPANLARHRTNPNLAFWKMLKIGNDHFEATHLEPKVDVCNRLYVFDAQRPPNSRKPLVFNPTGKCPAFVVNPKIARRALEKKRNDELEYAQLLKENVPAATIYSGLDGGMNKAFLAKFPGRVTLAKVMPYASYLPE